MVKSRFLFFFCFIWILASVLTGCARHSDANPNSSIRILMEPWPATLNPRFTLDASGQLINALIFRALTRFDTELKAQPDLAERWEVSPNGLSWKFWIKPELKDHAQNSITAAKIAQCLENYRVGKPSSPLREGLPTWKGTTASESSVTLQLSRPDPYVMNNVSLFRYFITPGSSEPCQEPRAGEPVIASGWFQPEKWDPSPEVHLFLKPVPGTLDRPLRPIDIAFVTDNNTKVLKLLHGDIDVIYNALPPSRQAWLRKNYSDRFVFMERESVRVNYLAFNLKDPILSKRDVRKAISMAIHKEALTEHKFLKAASPAHSLLYPLLSESYPTPVGFNPEKAEELLDRAGFPRGKNGVRFELHYKCTPVREGKETALFFQKMLKKVGIDLLINVVEPAVFHASTRKGNFQLYSSRWLGIKDASILYKTLHSKQTANRWGYSNPKMDALLEQAISEPSEKRRIQLWKQVQELATDDLPYFPLWYWTSFVLMRKELTGLEPSKISLSGALEPLTFLR